MDLIYSLKSNICCWKNIGTNSFERSCKRVDNVDDWKYLSKILPRKPFARDVPIVSRKSQVNIAAATSALQCFGVWTMKPQMGKKNASLNSP